MTVELTNICREGGLQAGLPLLSLQRLNKSGFFSTDVRSCTAHNKHVKIITRTARILTDQPSSIGLIYGHLKEKKHLYNRLLSTSYEGISTACNNSGEISLFFFVI